MYFSDGLARCWKVARSRPNRPAGSAQAAIARRKPKLGVVRECEVINIMYCEGNGDPYARIALRVNREHLAAATVPQAEDGLGGGGATGGLDPETLASTYPALYFAPGSGALGSEPTAGAASHGAGAGSGGGGSGADAPRTGSSGRRYGVGAVLVLACGAGAGV